MALEAVINVGDFEVQERLHLAERNANILLLKPLEELNSIFQRKNDKSMNA
jgi:hypothetical protein